MQELKISLIIPAYNEELGIGNVLLAVKDHPFIDEVIVVDDGSRDQTAALVNSHKEKYWQKKIRLITHKVNKGKNAAFITGLKEAKNELLLFLDADLVGLNSEAITKLIEPVLSGQVDISVSLKKNSLLIYKLMGLDFVSGERIYHKKIIEPHLNEIARLPGFAVETYINKIIVEQKLRIKVVKWENVSHLRKSDKYGHWQGFKGEVSMIWQILKYASIFEIIKLNYKMIKLKI